jgi:hypothetical protein
MRDWLRWSSHKNGNDGRRKSAVGYNTRNAWHLEGEPHVLSNGGKVPASLCGKEVQLHEKRHVGEWPPLVVHEGRAPVSLCKKCLKLAGVKAP